MAVVGGRSVLFECFEKFMIIRDEPPNRPGVGRRVCQRTGVLEPRTRTDSRLGCIEDRGIAAWSTVSGRSGPVSMLGFRHWDRRDVLSLLM
jgi:hypothetical protein